MLCVCFFIEPQSNVKRNDGNGSLTAVDSDTDWKRSGLKSKSQSNRRESVAKQNSNQRDYDSNYDGSFHGIKNVSTINSNTFNNALNNILFRMPHFYQKLFEFDPKVHFKDIKTKLALIHWTRIYGLCTRFLNDITTVNITNTNNISNTNVNINVNSINRIDLNILYTISKYQDGCIDDSFVSAIYEYSKTNSNFEYILCHLCKHNIPSIFVKNEIPINDERQKTDTQINYQKKEEYDRYSNDTHNKSNNSNNNTGNNNGIDGIESSISRGNWNDYYSDIFLK